MAAPEPYKYWHLKYVQRYSFTIDYSTSFLPTNTESSLIKHLYIHLTQSYKNRYCFRFGICIIRKTFYDNKNYTHTSSACKFKRINGNIKESKEYTRTLLINNGRYFILSNSNNSTVHGKYFHTNHQQYAHPSLFNHCIYILHNHTKIDIALDVVFV